MTTPMPPPNLTQDEEAAVHVPFLIYVVWRPDYPAGAAVAEYLREHFTADRYSNITGGTGVPVLFSSAVDPQANTALHVDMNRADATAVVLLVDRDFARDAAWTEYIDVLTADTQAIGLNARMFPVAMEERALDAPFRQQALRWDRWEGIDGTRERRLVRDLTHEFSRMLRHHLALGPHTTDNRRALQHYRQRVPVFLSHSKARFRWGARRKPHPRLAPQQHPIVELSRRARHTTWTLVRGGSRRRHWYAGRHHDSHPYRHVFLA